MRRRIMGAISLSDSRFGSYVGNEHGQHGAVIEEIEGLIRVYKDGHVERSPIVPTVSAAFATEPDVISRDVTVDDFNGVWARFYVPKRQTKLPLLVYFHGGGFCVGSAAWRCYHGFLSKLASAAECLIMSVNYRLAPEHRLPAAFDDGISAVKWVHQQAVSSSDEQSWWSARCNFSKVFVGGDSAGACLAHNVATRLGAPAGLKPVRVKGVVLIQPFFAGEARTASERNMVQPASSALSLRASDAYWRLALPPGANRDHPWCNPLSKGAYNLENLSLPPTMVCISELDILKDRNLEFVAAMKSAGKSVEQVVYTGVRHAFQILRNYPLSQVRTHEMIAHIKAFISDGSLNECSSF
ncbi:probable carboxylesterase 17 [Aristolochia californica]|uniref:probable carboxylesterase 17 n=1 Tax=Aristolochia californica TaxID=171875 RepID=UPI0035E1AEBC